MTANQTANPTLFVIPGGSPRRPDPVRARVEAPRQLTNFETLQATVAPTPEPRRSLHLLPGALKAGSRRLHPGDIFYWIACLGGACLLLLSATT
jgi:hypothetical protein